MTTFPPLSGPAEPSAEIDLVRRARQGDPSAQEELFLTHRRGLYLLALQLLGNPEDALDATQDVMLRFLTSLDRFQSGRPIKPWLFTILRNRCRDLLRRRRVRRHEPIGPDEDHWRPELIDPGTGPEERLQERRTKQRVWEALGQLSSGQREILVLRDYQDLSYAEIAGVLQVPQGTVMSRLHRARKQLAERLRTLDVQSEEHPS